MITKKAYYVITSEVVTLILLYYVSTNYVESKASLDPKVLSD